MRFDLGGKRRGLVRKRRARRVAESQGRTVRPARRRADTPPTARKVRPGRIIAGAAAAMLLMALTRLLVFPGYRIVGADIQGNVRTPAAAIYAASGLDGHSVFSADIKEAATGIMSIPDIERASVAIRLPHQVSIEVEETDIVLFWQAGETLYAVDENGRAISPPAQVPPGAAPTIIDISGRPLSVGDRLPADVFAAAQAYSAAFDALRWDGDGFVSEGESGWLIRLGADPALAAHQRAVIDGLQSHSSGTGDEGIELVDLRFPNRPYIRADAGAGSP